MCVKGFVGAAAGSVTCERLLQQADGQQQANAACLLLARPLLVRTQEPRKPLVAPASCATQQQLAHPATLPTLLPSPLHAWVCLQAGEQPWARQLEPHRP